MERNIRRIEQYRENLGKNENRELIMFAKKLLEKEGFIVKKRIRENYEEGENIHYNPEENEET
jgi:hypothetical protein